MGASLLWLRVSSRTASGGRAAATLRVVLDETLSQSSNSTKGFRVDSRDGARVGWEI